MKIKLDFVTNSSSTAYVVIIPSSIKLLKSVKEIEETQNYEDALEYQYEEDKDLMLTSFNETLQELKNGHDVYYDDHQAFFIVRDYLVDKGCIFKDIEMNGGGGMDIMVPVTSEEIHKTLNRIEANEIES